MRQKREKPHVQTFCKKIQCKLRIYSCIICTRCQTTIGRVLTDQ